MVRSKIRGLEFSWNYSSNEIPMTGKKSENFQLTIIAKASVSIDEVDIPPERGSIHVLNPEQPAEKNLLRSDKKRGARYTALLNI